MSYVLHFQDAKMYNCEMYTATAATGQYYNYNNNNYYYYYCEGAGDDSNNISECCQLKPVWRVIGVDF